MTHFLKGYHQAGPGCSHASTCMLGRRRRGGVLHSPLAPVAPLDPVFPRGPMHFLGHVASVRPSTAVATAINVQTARVQRRARPASDRDCTTHQPYR